MSMFDDPFGGSGEGPRSEGEIQAAIRALADVGTNRGRSMLRGPKKLPNKGNRGSHAGSKRVNPNEMTEVTVSLPLSMVMAAGENLDLLVYEGLRERLGAKWAGPRFLMKLEATRMRGNERFTEQF